MADPAPEVSPAEWKRKRRQVLLIGIWAGVPALGLLALYLLLLLNGGVHYPSDAEVCQRNLTQIDGAKEQYALDSSRRPDPVITVEHITQSGTGFLKAMPTCPSGYSYIINPIGTDPVCNSGLPGHSLREIPTLTPTR